MSAFDQVAALDLASARVTDLVREARDRTDKEASYAVRLAEAYSTHLANGLSPADFREVDYDLVPTQSAYNASYIVSPYAGAVAVYKEWNELRDPPNPVVPLPYTQRQNWLVCERLRESLGTPVLYADLAKIGSNVGKLSSEKVAEILLAFEKLGAVPGSSDAEAEWIGGPYVVRRTKLDSKSAFLLRRRTDADPPLGAYRAYNLPEERL